MAKWNLRLNISSELIYKRKENEMNKFKIQDREAGNLIEVFNSKEEAIKALAKYEESDKAEGIYEEDFYEIVEV